MGPQFSQLLAYHGNTVIAMGPLGRNDSNVGDYVEELHAWIYQEASVESHAVAMPLTSPGAAILQEAGKCWMVPLTSITPPGKPGLHAGRGFAVAIALFSNDSNSRVNRGIGSKEGHVIWWGHPIQLLDSPDAVADATSGAYADNPGKGFDEITTTLQDLWTTTHSGAPT
jgi:hypothetical protein